MHGSCGLQLLQLRADPLLPPDLGILLLLLQPDVRIHLLLLLGRPAPTSEPHIAEGSLIVIATGRGVSLSGGRSCPPLCRLSIHSSELAHADSMCHDYDTSQHSAHPHTRHPYYCTILINFFFVFSNASVIH